jgi:type IV pilus assembly protein PilW
MKRAVTSEIKPVRSRQLGFTLVELMVTVLIGLFLLAGLISLVGGMKRSQGTQNDMATLQDNERLAMTLMTNVIESAGYYPHPEANTVDSQLPAIAGTFAISGQPIFGKPATAPATGDTVSARYVSAGADGVLDCTGNNTVGAQIINFRVSPSISDPTIDDLVCTINGGPDLHLVTGISSMQIYYGVQTNLSLSNASVDSYLTATQVTATTNWSNVISVKIKLLFKNPSYGKPGQTQASAATIPFTRVIKLLNKPGFVV